MFSSFTKLLPTNVTISTPDFLKNHNPLAQGSNSTPTNGHSATAATTATASATSATATTQQAAREPPSRTNTVGTTGSQDVTKESPRKDGKKKRKDVSATETFIIVRPPPSKSNHPLNLQVQLVPTGRERVQRGSVSSTLGNRSNNASRETVNTLNDGTGTHTNANGLERTVSIRSDAESTYSASSNLSSSSTVSGTGNSRRIIPLYNLHAHNVMTNVITDAGTDAKIAKFFKRGLEIMGLAMLEPVEVYGRYRWSDSFDALDRDVTMNIARTGSHMSHTSHTSTSTSRPGTAGGGGAANASASNIATHHELEPVIESPSSPSTPKGDKENATKKLFGGLFKKKKDPPSPLPLGLRGHRSSKSIGESPLTPSVLVSTPVPSSVPSTPNVPRTPTLNPSALPSSGPEVVLQPQILGLQAILQSPVNPPKGRPTTYVWVIRKWIKASNEGLLGAVADTLGLPGINMIMPGGSGSGSAQGSAISNMGGPGNLGPTECEVRFEWKRGNKVLKSAAAAANAAKANEEERQDRQRKRLSRTESPTRKSRNESPVKKSRYSIQADPTRRGSVHVDENGALLSAGAAAATSPASKRLSFQGFGKKAPQPTQQGSSENLRPGQGASSLSPNPNQRSGSPNPPASLSTSVNTDDNPHATRDAEYDSEEESDPEDSERPWNCYVHVRRAPFYRARGSRTSLAGASYSQPHSRADTGHRVQGEDGEEEESLDIKLRVACLMPAPHHPKVVAQVKTPYPLPDIVFDRPSYSLPAHGSGFSKYANIFSSSNSGQDSASNTTSSRFSNTSGNHLNPNSNSNTNGHANGHGHGVDSHGFKQGQGQGQGQVDNLSVRKPGARLRPRDPDVPRSEMDDPQGPNAPLILTAEEIKDVVSCTGLWLVVREGYGGLAKKRKGDGWRLRG